VNGVAPPCVAATWHDTPQCGSRSPASSRDGHALIMVATLAMVEVPERNATVGSTLAPLRVGAEARPK